MNSRTSDFRKWFDSHVVMSYAHRELAFDDANRELIGFGIEGDPNSNNRLSKKLLEDYAAYIRGSVEWQLGYTMARMNRDTIITDARRFDRTVYSTDEIIEGVHYGMFEGLLDEDSLFIRAWYETNESSAYVSGALAYVDEAIRRM